jgi:integrase
MDLENPCEKYKKLKDANQKSKRRPPTYSQEELDALFAACDDFERAVLGTLLLAGLRKQELYFLTWSDIDFQGRALCNRRRQARIHTQRLRASRNPHAPGSGTDPSRPVTTGSMGIPKPQWPPAHSPFAEAEGVGGTRRRTRSDIVQISAHLLYTPAGNGHGHRHRQESDGA